MYMLTFQPILSILSLAVLKASMACSTGSASECEKAPFVPGYNLAGEGFDVVKMRRTGAYLINVKAHMRENQTCTLCQNRFNGQVQKLPSAVLDWRSFSRCSKQMSSALHHSVRSLVRSSSSVISNNWRMDLSLDNIGQGLLGGSRSDIAMFAMSQNSVDKATFAQHEISCTYYSYRLMDQPELSSEFSKNIQRLPQQYDEKTQAVYRRTIDTYGTHYIRHVHLGGKLRRITSFRTCLATLKGFTETEIKNCLNLELKLVLGFLPANTSFSNKCLDILKDNMSMGFYQGFMTHKIEVLGGENYIPDILVPQSSSDAYASWMNSLQENPEVISYAIFSLHHLVKDLEIRANLKAAISDYIHENMLPLDRKQDQCVQSPNLDHNCCPLRAGRASLFVEVHRASGLKADTFTDTDAYVKVWYNQMYQETEVIENNNNPMWNASYDFGPIDLGHQLVLEVWDTDVIYNDMAGRCVVFPENGSYSHGCKLKRGVLYFTYSAQCDAYLTGYRCEKYSPKP
ncbi:perforin-1-like [Denticeps clupeoides]|uniref:Perforin-1-like n=1 Tax=Denticeps clupeoides TaxID=299321 RepID=A0A8C4A284_9TELE|nr:perforin-1-like [Denticeps clupeoides]XP_028852455.1 perforin-1-like [Denticeps clupeoides]